MKTIRLTAAQALVKYLSVQRNEDGEMLIPAAWGIFGHGNVVGMGEALHGIHDTLPTYRGQNEQTMAHTAIAYAKAKKRKQAMMVTSSIGPGATNMVTAAALAHANRIPVLFVPGDVFASRAPDPVLQQIEYFQDGTISATDCFRPVSRYYDRISRPEHLLTALPRAMRVLTDSAECGPVTLAFNQDTQGEAFDYPAHFFNERTWIMRRPEADAREIANAVELIKAAKNPVIIAGGGVFYSDACAELADFAAKYQIPVVETQAGKSALSSDHKMNFGPVGVTGGDAANALCNKADLVIALGTRLQDFTTGSWSIFKNPDHKILSINVAPYDSIKHNASPLVSDARAALARLDTNLSGVALPAPDFSLKDKWANEVSKVTDAPKDGNALPTDMQVVGAVQRTAAKNTIVMGAAGTMPGELHKLWNTTHVGGYHMEYGFSCMGYEVAGALGIKMASPEKDVICMVGDGSYMMANSELATAVMMDQKITLVITNNRGFGCINRLQMGTGGAEFNNLLDKSYHVNPSQIDFVMHTASMGAESVQVSTIAELEAALVTAKSKPNTQVIVIDTDPYPSTEAGGSWWEVGVPEVSVRKEVNQARAKFEAAKKEQAR